jgi:hypothetical protein
MWINVASIVTNINAIDRAQVPSFGQCYTWQCLLVATGQGALKLLQDKEKKYV